MKVKKTILAIVRNLIAWIFSAICLIPLLLILFNSLKDKKAASSAEHETCTEQRVQQE